MFNEIERVWLAYGVNRQAISITSKRHPGEFGGKTLFQQMMYLYLMMQKIVGSPKLQPQVLPKNLYRLSNTKTLQREPNCHAETSPSPDHRPVPTYSRRQSRNGVPAPEPPHRSFSSAKITATTPAAATDSDHSSRHLHHRRL